MTMLRGAGAASFSTWHLHKHRTRPRHALCSRTLLALRSQPDASAAAVVLPMRRARLCRRYHAQRPFDDFAKGRLVRHVATGVVRCQT
jgi:hypothetical protein